MRAELTVVMPARAVDGPWVRQAAESVLMTRGIDLRLVMVGRVLAEPLRRTLERIVGADPRVTVVDGGIADIAVATRYAVLVGADELVPRDAFAALVRSLDASGSELAVGDSLVFGVGWTREPNTEVRAFRVGAVGLGAGRVPSIAEATGAARGLMRRELWERACNGQPTADEAGVLLGRTALRLARGIDVLPDVVRVFREPDGLRGVGAARQPRSLLVRAPRRAARVVWRRLSGLTRRC